jgi:hypothetical protein
MMLIKSATAEKIKAAQESLIVEIKNNYKGKKKKN